MNNLLSVFTPAQTVICIVVAIVGLLLIATNVVLFAVFHKRGERKLYDKLLQQERELLMQQLQNMKTGEGIDKENVNGVIDSVQNSERYGASEEKTISDLRNIIATAAEKFEVVTRVSISEEVAVAAEPAPVPVFEPAPTPAPAAQEEEQEEQEDIESLPEEEEEIEVFVTETGRIMRYNRSFTARIIQGGDLLQSRYNELKNYLLSHKKVKSRISWKRDSFRFGRATVASFAVRGKTLCLFLALDPKRFEETKYKVKDYSVRSPKSPTPLLYQIRNDRRVNYAKELIDLLMAELGALHITDYEEADFRMPYETTEALIGRELIKVLGEGGAPFSGIPATESEAAEEEPVKEEAALQTDPGPAEEKGAANVEPESAEDAEDETEEILEEISLGDFSDDEDSEEDGEAEVVVTETGSVMRYNRSFTARIIQSDDALKERYSVLKNHIFSYRGVKNKISWKRETFRKGRICLATIVVRGKTMCLCLNDDPAKYADTKYKVEDLSLHSRKTKTPLLYRIKNDRRLNYAKELIDAAFTAIGLTKTEREPVAYAEPFAESEELIARGLIRVTESAPAFFSSQK